MQVIIITDETVQSICETEFPSDILNKRKITVQTVSGLTLCMISKGKFIRAASNSMSASFVRAARNSVLASFVRFKRHSDTSLFLQSLTLITVRKTKP
jgi:hypothetical protein